ncbi:MAG: hypothetical protein LBH74_04545 [Nitrososphaerota archaeon]|nr:hypothetical protein [Nitrososphaerota archaeon]
MAEIGDYVIASDLNYAVSGGTGSTVGLTMWLNDAKERWGEQFIGIYYNDEPGGKMLDTSVTLEKTFIEEVHEDGGSKRISDKITKNSVGEISFDDAVNEIRYSYLPDGTAIVQNYSAYTHYPNGTVLIVQFPKFTYYPDGTVTIMDFENNYFYAVENITKYPSQIPSYKEVIEQNPIQNNDDAADAFVKRTKEELEDPYHSSSCLNKTQLEQSILVFTSDYGLYWWDYQAGYDMVLAQLGWNNSVNQEIGLVRGAANLQDKSWGTIITWKYTQPPFLADGQEIFEQMKTSYETGAEYIIVFNYSEDPTNPNTLKEEHFQALERFWVEVVQNPEITHGNIKAEAALVLPRNFGWSIRNPTDRIWGIWTADNTSQKVWDQVQTRLNHYGAKLDIIYDDQDYPPAGRYSNIYYVNVAFPYVWLIAVILLLSIAAVVLLVYFKRQKNQTTKSVVPAL